MTIKEDYKKLKFTLPSYEAINKEFEISAIDETDLLVRNIRKKIKEKIEDFIEILERILQPNTDSFIDLYESKFIEDNEKNEIYNFFKRIMVLNKEAITLSILNDDNKDAEFIINIMKDWESIKKQMEKINDMLKECWKKETDIENDLKYLG